MHNFVRKLNLLITELEEDNEKKRRSKGYRETAETITWTIEELIQIREDLEKINL